MHSHTLMYTKEWWQCSNCAYMHTYIHTCTHRHLLKYTCRHTRDKHIYTPTHMHIHIDIHTYRWRRCNKISRRCTRSWTPRGERKWGRTKATDTHPRGNWSSWNRCIYIYIYIYVLSYVQSSAHVCSVCSCMFESGFALVYTRTTDIAPSERISHNRATSSKTSFSPIPNSRAVTQREFYKHVSCACSDMTNNRHSIIPRFGSLLRFLSHVYFCDCDAVRMCLCARMHL